MSKEEAKAFVEQLLREPELRVYLREQLTQDFVLRSSAEEHFTRLYQEIVYLRQENEQPWADIGTELKRSGEDSKKRWQTYSERSKKEWEEHKAPRKLNEQPTGPP